MISKCAIDHLNDGAVDIDLYSEYQVCTLKGILGLFNFVPTFPEIPRRKVKGVIVVGCIKELIWRRRRIFVILHTTLGRIPTVTVTRAAAAAAGAKSSNKGNTGVAEYEQGGPDLRFFVAGDPELDEAAGLFPCSVR